MADSANIVVRKEYGGYRNTVVRATLVSDGSGLANFVLVDPTVAAAGAVNISVTQAGQVFYPGIHLTLMELWYDVQALNLSVLWKATANEAIVNFGNAPQDFDWSGFGGLKVPPALAGATGAILLTTAGQAAGSTFTLILRLRNNVPQS